MERWPAPVQFKSRVKHPSQFSFVSSITLFIAVLSVPIMGYPSYFPLGLYFDTYLHLQLLLFAKRGAAEILKVAALLLRC